MTMSFNIEKSRPSSKTKISKLLCVVSPRYNAWKKNLISKKMYVVFLNEAKDLPYWLNKNKRVGRLISRKPAKNWYRHPRRPSWNGRHKDPHNHPWLPTQIVYSPSKTRVVVKEDHQCRRHSSATSMSPTLAHTEISARRLLRWITQKCIWWHSR